MAANYWNSTQRQYWSFPRDKLVHLRHELEEQNAKIVEQFPLPDRRLVFIFLKDRLLQLAKPLPFRQQCVATALVYMHRYLLSNVIQNVNLYLLVATAFYLASKTEESPHHIRIVASEARRAWPDYISADVSKIGEMEFSLISEMHSQLIIWHPYRTLMALKGNAELGLAGEEVGFAWSIINDSFMADLPLTCPPHMVAVVAIFLAVVFQPNKAALGLHNLPQPTSSSVENGPFSSLGGRPGLFGALSAATNSSAPGQPTSHPHSQTPNGASGTGSSTRAKIATMALASDKIQRLMQFLAESEIDLEEMIQATQEIISLYEIWEQYSEKAVKEAIARYLKQRGVDS